MIGVLTETDVRDHTELGQPLLDGRDTALHDAVGALGHSVYVCADAVGSRRALDRDTAMQRLGQAGAVITTVESLLFELSLDCKAPRFKAVLELVKAEHRGQA